MGKKISFAKILYIISMICFYGCLVTITFLFSISLIISKSEEPIGYPLKVDIRTEASDTIISYKKGTKERIHSFNKLAMYRQKTYNVMKDSTYQKAMLVQRLALYDNNGKDVSSQFTKTFLPYHQSEGEIFIEPKDKPFLYIVATRYYLIYFLAALIFWQISRFFKALSRDFSFHTNLRSRLKTIAFTLIGYQLIMLILSFINRFYLPKAETLTSVPTISGAEIVTITYRTCLEYNLQMIFFALGLLCIARLLDYGYNLQKENDLTI